MAELRLTDPLKNVLGAATAKALADGLSLRTVEDLLRHYPRRYAERGQLTDLGSLEIDEHVTVMAQVLKAESKAYQDRRTGRRQERLEVIVTDGKGKLTLTFFKQSWRKKDLYEGRVGLFSGKVGAFRGQRQLTHPDYVLLPDSESLPDSPSVEGDEDTLLRFAGQLIPVYPATAQMATRCRWSRAPRTVCPTCAGRCSRCTGPSRARTSPRRASGCGGTRPSCCRQCSRSVGSPPRRCRPYRAWLRRAGCSRRSRRGCRSS